MANTLWVERYRPQVVDDYVWQNDSQRNMVNRWIQEKTIPHLLFSGSPGTGKTTLAKILLNSLELNEYDILEINASRDNGVDYIREKIERFVGTMPFGDYKVVLLDEADYLSPNAQAVLRGLMETYSASSRFILTCNYPNKIMPALHSRCQGFHIDKIDETEFTARMAKILLDEGVTFDIDLLDTFVRASYPDLRKCINNVQLNVSAGVLQKPETRSESSQDYRIEAVALMKQGQYRAARQLIINQIRLDEIEEFYRWTYDNLGLWAKDIQRQDEAIVTIAQALANHGVSCDPEITLSACLIQLCNLSEKEKA